MFTDTDDIDFDNIFDDLQDHVEAHSNESIFDKFDRLREAYEWAYLASNLQDFERRCEAIMRSLLPDEVAQSLTYSGQALWSYTKGADNWLSFIAEGEVRFHVKGDDRQVPCERTKFAILDTVRQMKHEADAILSTKIAYKAVRDEIGDTLTEGCRVTFSNPYSTDSWGYVVSCVRGEGTVIGITEKTFIIQIDCKKSDSRITATTARIKISTAFDGVFDGGRDLRLEWGPRGWAREVQRQAEFQAERDRQRRIRAEAEERMCLAWESWRDLNAAWEAYHAELRNLDSRAHQAATVELVGLHNDEYQSLVEAQRLQINQYIDESRPLDELPPEPSNNYTHYLEDNDA